MHDGKQPEVIALERQKQTAELLAELLGGGQTIFKSASLSCMTFMPRCLNALAVRSLVNLHNCSES